MLRVQFEEDLEKLHNQFYAMGNEVLTQINRTVRAFVTHDRDLARQVIEDDAEINEYEVKLERKSFEMIALQQPVSQDLRLGLPALKLFLTLSVLETIPYPLPVQTAGMRENLRVRFLKEKIGKLVEKSKPLLKPTLRPT